jgi:hypothetical protein
VQRWEEASPEPAQGAALVWLMVAVLSAFTAVAAAHPGLRLVDFLSFAARARRLPDGVDLVQALYPIGYPGALLGGQALTGDVLVAGKAIAVLAGVGIVAVTARLVGVAGALFVALSPAVLTWATTEGTDAPAAALLLTALACGARGKGGWAGLALGGALLCRYTAIAALPVLLLAMSGGLRARRDLLVVLALATVPHWGLALWTSAPLLPDQGSNLAIAQGQGPPGSGGPWLRWWFGVVRAWRDATGDWEVRLGLLGLLFGLVRRQRFALLLVLLLAAHLAGIGLYFSKPRLVFPATLCALVGVAYLLPRRPLLVLAVAMGLSSLPAALDQDGEEEMVARGAALVADLPAPVLSSSPWLYQRVDGWLQPAVNLKLMGDSHSFDPAALWSRGRAGGFRHVALETGRVRPQYPGLQGLLRGTPPSGFRVVARQGGWTVLELVD